MIAHKKVKFRGEIYWYHDTGWGVNLSPISHYSEEGELHADPFHDTSYAIILGNDIMQFGKIIGDISELEDCP